MSTGTFLHVDACERHRIQIAEMTRGAGANSNNIREFAFFIEVTAYIDAFNEYTKIYQTRDDALEYILKECAEDSTKTIGTILYQRFLIDKALKDIVRRKKAESQQSESE